MKTIYTAFVKQVNFENSKPLTDLMFVSLDKNSWLEIDKPIHNMTIDYYDDIKKLFDGNGRTRPMRIGYALIAHLAQKSENNVKIKEIK